MLNKEIIKELVNMSSSLNIKEPISDCCGDEIVTIDNGIDLELQCNDCGDDCIDINFDFNAYCEENPDFELAFNNG